MTELNSTTNRREFIKNTGTAAIGGALALNLGVLRGSTFKPNSDTLKVGLIGCGGRGTGAASQALTADNNTVLTYMADIFPDRMMKSIEALKQVHGERVSVTPENQFIGFDAYKKVMETDVDVVILTTPPSFRPDHLMAAVNAGKHVFSEKPVAVDAPGVRKVLDAARIAKEKSLSLMSGFCWRYDFPKRETFSRLLNGDIGEIMSIYNTYNTGDVWSMPREEKWSDLEFVLRNWVYYSWLSGDHIIEQAVHSIDMMSWAFGDKMPVKATGTGGRQRRVEDIYGNVFDHFAVVYEYENGAKGFHFSRQQKDCSRSYALDIAGTNGSCLVDCIRQRHEIRGPKKWRYEGEKNDMYQTEHDELFAAIRKGTPVNDGEWMANSTMLGVLGRMVAYTGQTITWEEALNSQEILGPAIDEFSWTMQWPNIPVAKPGITKFS